MIKNVFYAGYLDYKNLILENYDKLGLNLNEALVVIRMLDLIKAKKDVKITTLSKLTMLDKKIVDEVLSHLLELNYLEISVEIKNNKGVEVYNLDSLFLSFESLFAGSYDQEEATDLASHIEGKLSRLLTSKELEIVTGFINDGITIKEVDQSIDRLLHKNSKISIPALEKDLYSAKTSSTSKEEDMAALKAIKMIKERR